MKGTLSLLLMAFVILALPNSVFTQVHEDWIRRYNGSANNNDWAKKITVIDQGKVCVMGSTYEANGADDYRIIVYNAEGDTVQNSHWNQGHIDTPYDTYVSNDGYIYITGSAYASWPTYNTVFNLKYNLVKNSLCWANTISSTSVGRAITADQAGNVYITGTWSSPSKALIIKYDSTGWIVWERSLNESTHYSSYGKDIEVDHAGNVYCLVDAHDVNGVADYAVVKYNSDGDTLWIACYDNDGQPDEPIGFALDGAGNVYVTGTSGRDYATVKYDRDGNRQWAAIYDGPNNLTEQASAIMIDDSSNVYVTGTSGGDYATVKYDRDGHEQWVSRYGGPGNNHAAMASAFTLDSKGSIYVTGEGPTATGLKIGTVNYDRNGKTIWDISSSGNEMPSHAASIAVDTSGNVYVTGSVDDITGLWSDWITIKYHQSSTDVNNAAYFGRQPSSYSLDQNYPNPFNPTTWIDFQIPHRSQVSVTIFDVLGREVARLISEQLPAGAYSTKWNAAGRTSGVYYYQLKTDNFVQTKKLILLK
ncbi:MAG TPA: SBBP repeat-containing protein [Bacteroidota bacterium]|nr:SBBP repeat-containing protein [Bacteroidota bacterium]